MSGVRYYNLLFNIGKKLDELNDIERLTFMCRGKISEGSEDSIINARALFLELERQGHLGIDSLDDVREMLKELEEWELLRKVLEFESTREEVKELEEERCRMTGQSARILSSAKWAVGKMLGALKLHCNFRTISGGVVVVGAVVILRKCSTLPEFMDAFTKIVLPTTTKLCAISEGSVCFTVQAENLSALQVLWQQYQDGTLQKTLQDFLITEEIKLLADGQEVIVNVNIDDQEYKEACLDLIITETKALQKEPLSQRPRRSSDSLLHCPSRKAEEERWKLRKSELPESGVKGKHNFGDQAEDMDPERLAYVQRYVERLQDTHSVTSETTDSGLGTQGAPSVLGAEEYSDICKDLSDKVIRDISRRLEKDKVAWTNVCVALQLTGLEGRKAVRLEDILSFFPATPVRLLQDVFNALELYDLVELLEKEVKFNHSSLRLQRTLQEVRTLRKSAERPTTYHSNVAVLIISEEGAEDSEGIEKFFMDLKSDNDVTIIPGLGRNEREWMKEDLKRLEKRSNKKLRQLMWLRKRSVDEKYRKLMGLGKMSDEELNEQRMLLETQLSETEKTEKVALETVERWIQNQGRFTFFAVFDFTGVLTEYKFMKEKLEILSDKDKLVFTPFDGLRTFEKLPETLLVSFLGWRHISVPDAVGKIFNKRWQTLDLCSMMEELKRTVSSVHITDNMSCSVRFKKLEDKDSA